jgi:hypothetical protein
MPSPNDDSWHSSEQHLQAIARFVVGFGTEAREYGLDFAGEVPIEYDAYGVPTEIRPVGMSGYSMGNIQWDFGQGGNLEGPLIDAFIAWHQKHPNEPNLVSSRKLAVEALGHDGTVLRAHPEKGLRQQDVVALTRFAQSDEGSDWINVRIDGFLIGSNAQKKAKQGEHSLVGAAREVEKTETYANFKQSRDWLMVDMVYATGMKVANQKGTSVFENDFLRFLSTKRSAEEVKTWRPQRGVKTGVENIIELVSDWHGLPSSDFLSRLDGVMSAAALTNPSRQSRVDGAYVLAKQVFERIWIFKPFYRALSAHKDWNYPRAFDERSGAIVRDPETGRLIPSMSVKSGVAYVWDTWGNAYQYVNAQWQSIDFKEIRIK